MPTPYDGQIGVLHWYSGVVPETKIDVLLTNLKRKSRNINAIWVKTTDGVK